MFPLGQWVFLALSTSTTSQKQTGFRYTLTSTSTRTIHLETISGSFYDMEIDGTIFIGGDSWYNTANALQQYVRFYLNYYPSTEDEFINLATMDTGTILMLQLKYFDFLMLRRHALPCSLQFISQCEQ